MILTFETSKRTTDRTLQDITKGLLERNIKSEHCEFDMEEYLKIPVPTYSKLEWKKLKQNLDDVRAFIWWGFTRNTKEIYKKAKETGKDFYFLDHAYIYHMKHGMFKDKLATTPFVRMVKNEFVLTTIKDTNDTKLQKMKLEFIGGNELDIIDWKKNGNKIVIIPPSQWLGKVIDLDVTKMMNDSIEKIKQHTDKEIVIRYKKPNKSYNPKPLIEDLKDAYAVVSFQSSSAAKAVTLGIPSFLMKPGYSAAQPMSSTDLTKIETPIYPDNRYEWLCSLANNQFTKAEIISGKAMEYLDEHDA